MAAVPDPLLVETVVLDGMWRVPDEAERGDRHRIVLVTWNGTDWSLPGGSMEPDESLEQTLAREVAEEACAHW